MVLLDVLAHELAGAQLQQQHAEVGAAQVQRQEHALLCYIHQVFMLLRLMFPTLNDYDITGTVRYFHIERIFVY